MKRGLAALVILIVLVILLPNGHAQEAPQINGKILELAYLPGTMADWQFAEIDPETGVVSPRAVVDELGGVNAFVSAIDPVSQIYYQPGLDNALNSRLFELSTVTGEVIRRTDSGNLAAVEFVSGRLYGVEINRVVSIDPETGKRTTIIPLDVSGILTGVSAARDDGFYFLVVDLGGNWRLANFSLPGGTAILPMVALSPPLTVQPVAFAWDRARLVGVFRQTGGEVQYGYLEAVTGAYGKVADLPPLKSLSQGAAAYDAGGYFLFPAVDLADMQRLYILNAKTGTVESRPVITFGGRRVAAATMQIRSFDIEPATGRAMMFIPQVRNDN